MYFWIVVTGVMFSFIAALGIGANDLSPQAPQSSPAPDAALAPQAPLGL